MNRHQAPHEITQAYHHRTKHHFNRYAAGPHHIDWQTQPEAFRRYEGATRFQLPLVADTLNSRYVDLYQPDKIPTQPFNLDKVAALLELSLGLSAWKQYGEQQWALRCNPSSGNLHPTEGYVILPILPDIPAGVYHYLSCDHVLEQRGELNTSAATLLGNTLPEQSFLLGLTSIPWREAWKYGERAFRYCQHDIGHALGALRYAVITLGWSIHWLADWGDEAIAAACGLNQAADFHPTEREIPEVMLCIHTDTAKNKMNVPAQSIMTALESVHWSGKANLLDSQHQYTWPIIDTVITATQKPATSEKHCVAPTLPPLLPSDCSKRAVDIIRQRRSAQKFDGRTYLSSARFYRLLDSLLPRRDVAPWDRFPCFSQVDLVFFVHRVTTLAPGLYIFLRHESALPTMLKHEQFDWVKPEACPFHLPFYHLVTGDCQQIAQRIACHQDIAADSAFSLGMLAKFEHNLTSEPWRYRQLFWEAGMIGQVLYLEAEAAEVRGTGIGCYFDDVFHELLGLTTAHYQSLYHFTVGTPLLDQRLQTLPPYAHLN